MFLSSWDRLVGTITIKKNVMNTDQLDPKIFLSRERITLFLHDLRYSGIHTAYARYRERHDTVSDN